MKRQSRAARRLGAFSICIYASLSCGGSKSKVPAAPTEDPLKNADADSLYKRGLALKAQGEYVAAEEYFKSSMDRGTPASQVVPQLVDSAIQSSRYRMALVYLEPSLAEEPNNWRLRFLAGTIYQALEEYREAEVELKRVNELAPQQSEPHFVLANVLAQQYGREDEARTLYLRFIELQPEGTTSIIARRWLHEHPPEKNELKELKQP